MNALRFAALLLTAAPLASLPASAQQPQKPPAGFTNQLPPSVGNVPQPRREKTFELGATWVATSLNGKPFGGERPSFSIDKQYRARGFGGCNTYTAVAYALREQRLAVGPILPTKKTCDKATMDVERAFFAAIRYAAQWDQQGQTLIIRGQNGELRLDRAL